MISTGNLVVVCESPTFDSPRHYSESQQGQLGRPTRMLSRHHIKIRITGESMLSIELSEETNNRLELLSLSTGRTMEYYLIEAIQEYLEAAEDRCEVMDQSANSYFSFIEATGFDDDCSPDLD